MIEGMVITELEKKAGAFTSIYHISKLGYPTHSNFQEIYCSHVHSNKVRGWYKHQNAVQNITVIKGLVKLVAYDDRVGSSTHGTVAEILLGDNNAYKLHLPMNIWYSFARMTEEEAYIINCLPLAYGLMENASLAIDSTVIPYLWKRDER